MGKDYQNRIRLIGKLLWGILFMLLTVSLCLLFADEIDGLIADVFLRLRIDLSAVYDLIDEHCILNLLLTLGVIGTFIELWYHIYRDRHFSFFRSTIATCAIILLCFQTKYVFVSTVLRFLRYNVLISLGAFVFLILSLRGACFGITAKWNAKKNKRNRKSKKLSFYSDTEGKKEISENRKKYAFELAERMLETDVSREAFAVGIEGEWGSGKTLFLNEIKENVRERAVVVDFNPWNSKGEEHLLKDFFATLTHCLSPYYGGISSPVSRYVSLLYSLKVNVTGNMNLQFSQMNKEKDLAERKEDIELALDSIGKPIVIFIDDIDRLEGKEVFEVLRIIRNTAVFRSTFYVVAYDRAYVVEQLSSLNISEGGDYLEKIFQISVQIPKPDERVLIEEFKSNCRKITIDPPYFNSMFVKVQEGDYHHMIKILSSFRKVNRFARQFAFNAEYMRKHLTEGEFELQDLLFLNLIEYCNGDLYGQIWQNPESIFEVKHHPSNNVQYYYWPNQNNKEEESKLPSACLYFVKRLFGGRPAANSRSIQFIDLFYKYFYLAQPEKELSSKEFLDMLEKSQSPNTRDGMKAIINSWIASKDSKSFNSIYSSFVTYPTIQKSSQTCKNYLKAAFYWLSLEIRDYKLLKGLLPKMLGSNNYRPEIRKEMTSFANNQLNYLTGEKHFHSVAFVLSDLIRRLDANEKLIVDRRVVEMALNHCIESFIECNHWDPILLFKDDGNQMRLVVSNCCMPLASQNNKHVNLVINQIIKYYSESNNKSQSYKAADSVRSKLSKVGSSQQLDLPDLIPIFGDDISLATKLLDDCFVPTPKQLLV